MLMGNDIYNKLIELITETFQMNAYCDNIAYNLDASNYRNVSNIFHHSFAHKFPELADNITDMMTKLNARGVRKGLTDETAEYGPLDVPKMFADVLTACKHYRETIISAIDTAEYGGDAEVKLHLEELLLTFLPYLKQADVWSHYASKYENDLKSFEIHFEDLTTFIEVIK